MTGNVTRILKLALIVGAFLAVAAVVVPESIQAEDTTFTCSMMEGAFGWSNCGGEDTCPGEFWQKGTYCDATCKKIDPKTKTAYTSGSIDCPPF